MAATGRQRGRSAQSGNRVRLGIINAMVLWAAGILGCGASIKLLLTELKHMSNPGAALECDISPLIGCGASLMSTQAHILGVPNSVLGIVAFAMLMVMATFAMFFPLPRSLWMAAGLAGAGGVGFVAWFLYHSIVTFRTLCPYCLVVWTATLFAAGILLPQALVAMRKKPSSATVMSHTWAYILVLHLVVALAIIIGMRTQIGALL